MLVMCCTVSPKFLCGCPNPQPLWLGPGDRVAADAMHYNEATLEQGGPPNW